MVHSVADKADFSAQLEAAGNRLVVVDFYATWCGPCKVIAPKLEAMAQEFKDEIIVLKVDVDENEEIAGEYQIEAMPTFVFIKSKNVVTRFSGANEAKVRETIVSNNATLAVCAVAVAGAVFLPVSEEPSATPA